MGIRFPLKTVLDYNDAGQDGTTSILGGVAKTFTLPQDTDNVIVKLAASVIAGGVSATFQTTDDGGVTWYDVARTSIVSFTGRSVLGGFAGIANAEWLSIPVISAGVGATTGLVTSVINVGSVVSFGQTIGSAAASTLGVKQYSGLPIMGTFNRVFLRYTAAVTSTDLARVQVKVNSESQNN